MPGFSCRSARSLPAALLLTSGFMLTSGSMQTAAAEDDLPVTACLNIDKHRDNLTVAEQDAAWTLFEQELRRQGRDVVARGCVETWTLIHVRLGETINIMVQGPETMQEAQVSRIEDLPSTYRHLLAPEVSQETTAKTWRRRSSPVEPTAVPAGEPSEETEEDAEVLLWGYLRMGIGTVVAGGVGMGPSLGAGTRIDLGSMSLDVSLGNVSFSGLGQTAAVTAEDLEDDSFGMRFNATWLRAAAHLPLASGRAEGLYGGAALGYGFTSAFTLGTTVRGGGLQPELYGGYSLLKQERFALWTELSAILPAYRAASDDVLGGTEKAWTPTFTLSLGLGSAPRWGA